MYYRYLGKTGLKISEVGMGTWQLANDPLMWVGADLKDSYASIGRYIELGGNFIDTAWIYGYDSTKPQHHPSEELIGKYLRENQVRDHVYLASKVPPKNMKWPAWQGIGIDEVFPSDWIISCVEDSLKSLGVDYIDLMQFHVWQDEFVNHDEWKSAIANLTTEGKVKHWGISINDYQPSNCLKTLDTGLIDTIQFIFNIFHQKPVEKLLPYAKQHNIGLIARVPLDEGGLSGKLDSQTKFADGDFRGSYFTPARLEELEARNNKLMEIAGDEVASLPELALRYILSFDEVSTVIPGTRRVKYVDANVAVSDGRKLSDKLMEELKNHTWERNFYANQDSAIDIER